MSLYLAAHAWCLVMKSHLYPAPLGPQACLWCSEEKVGLGSEFPSPVHGPFPAQAPAFCGGEA